MKFNTPYRCGFVIEIQKNNGFWENLRCDDKTYKIYSGKENALRQILQEIQRDWDYRIHCEDEDPTSDELLNNVAEQLKKYRILEVELKLEDKKEKK